MAYDSQRSTKHINSYDGAATSAGGATAAVTVFGRTTLMKACTIIDFNVQVGSVGDVGTSGSYVFVLQRSAAGTGAVAGIGTASATGVSNIAANAVIDGAVTVTHCDAGDDLLLVSGAGTVLPAGNLTIAGAEVLVAQGNVSMP